MGNILTDLKLLLLKNNDMSMTELLNRVNKKYDRNDALPNFHRKLSNETIKFKEMVEIAEVLGYYIAWIPKDLKLETWEGIHVSSHSRPANSNSNFLVAEKQAIYEDKDKEPPR